MITYLGYEDLSPKYSGYNVSIAYPCVKDSQKGELVATVYVTANVFDSYFSGLAFGDSVDLNVGWMKRELKTPLAFQYNPYFRL